MLIETMLVVTAALSVLIIISLGLAYLIGNIYYWQYFYCGLCVICIVCFLIWAN